MSEDMESKGIFFDLQWKTKSGGSEFASIGIWEVDDSSLDWFNFKPYLCQTLGNVGDVSISYVDSDGDVIPIDSDLEFQEALKFARRKAAVGQKIILKVEKIETNSTASGGMELSSNPIYLKSSNFIRERLRMNSNGDEVPGNFCTSYDTEVPWRIGNLASKLRTNTKNKDILCPLQSSDSPPLWFQKYMQKMKNEIICEVTTNVNNQVKKLLEDNGQKAQPVFIPGGSLKMPGSHDMNGKSSAWLVTKTKKKTSDEDSSDGAHKIEIKDSKILKKIEKLHKREKKLDHKKEKLEQTAKRIVERKEREYFSKLRLEIAGCKASHSHNASYKPKEPEKPINVRQKIASPEGFGNIPLLREMEETLMGVTIKADDQRIMPVRRGSNFTKVWKVINSGSAQWTDETEVRLSWGNAGLTPEVVAVKCPHLAPGEEGEIAITFSSPDFPGIFESNWHFYDKNLRFGGRMSCIISVHLITNAEQEQTSENSKQSSISSSNSAEFLVVPSTPLALDDNEDIAVDGVLQDGAASHAEEMPSVAQTIQPKVESFSSVPVPWVVDKDEKSGKEDKCECNGGKEIEFESISTDDLSGSTGSVEYESDDNFVVVPMPPCFRFDVPLNAGGYNLKAGSSEPKGGEGLPNPLQMDEPPHSPIHLQSTSHGYNLKAESSELREGEESPNPLQMEEPPQSPIHRQSTLHGLSLERKNTPPSDYSNLVEMPLQSEVSRDTGEVISMPITPPQPKPVTTSALSHSAVTQMSPNQSCQCLKPHVTPVAESDESSSSSSFLRPVSSSPSRTPENAGPTALGPKIHGSTSIESDQSPTSSTATKATSSSPQQSPENGRNIGGAEKSTNIPRAKSIPRADSSSPARIYRPIDLMPHGISEVINGAMNVTTTALSTAFAALDSILVNTTGSSVQQGIVYHEPPTMQQASNGSQQEETLYTSLDPQMADDMSQLVTMGFVNLDLNQALLRVYNNNLTDVIEVLLNGAP